MGSTLNNNNFSNKPKPNGNQLTRPVNGSCGLQPTWAGTLGTNFTMIQLLKCIMMMQPTLSPLSKLLLDLNFKTLISSMTSLKVLKMPKKLLAKLMMFSNKLPHSLVKLGELLTQPPSNHMENK